MIWKIVYNSKRAQKLAKEASIIHVLIMAASGASNKAFYRIIGALGALAEERRIHRIIMELDCVKIVSKRCQTIPNSPELGKITQVFR